MSKDINAASTGPPFVTVGDTITDTPLKGRSMRDVLAMKRQWWEEYVDEARAEGATAQTWKSALYIWLESAKEESTIAQEWALELIDAIDALEDRDS